MNQQKTGELLKHLRKEKGLTQEQLAEKLGVSNRSVSRWENGTTLPDISLMKCICEEFKQQIADPDFEGYCHCMLYYKTK